MPQWAGRAQRTLWMSGIKLRSPGLVAFIHWTILLNGTNTTSWVSLRVISPRLFLMLAHLTVLKTLVVRSFFSMLLLPAMTKEAVAKNVRAVGQWRQSPCFHKDFWQAGHLCCSFLETAALSTWLSPPPLFLSTPIIHLLILYTHALQLLMELLPINLW